MMEKYNTGRRSMDAYEPVVSSDIHVKETLRRLTREDPENGYQRTKLFFLQILLTVLGVWMLVTCNAPTYIKLRGHIGMPSTVLCF